MKTKEQKGAKEQHEGCDCQKKREEQLKNTGHVEDREVSDEQLKEDIRLINPDENSMESRG